jgi:hypothetical protein
MLISCGELGETGCSCCNVVDVLTVQAMSFLFTTSITFITTKTFTTDIIDFSKNIGYTPSLCHLHTTQKRKNVPRPTVFFQEVRPNSAKE